MSLTEIRCAIKSGIYNKPRFNMDFTKENIFVFTVTLTRLIQSGVDEGASLPLDGRNISVPGYENGNFVGPTIISNVTADMECYREVNYSYFIDLVICS